MTARTATAWELIGFDGNLRSIDGPDQSAFGRIVGGKALYESVEFADDSRQTKARLARLDAVTDSGDPNGPWRLKQVDRYVDPDTLLEVVDASGDQ